MERNLSVAQELGYIDVPEGSVIRADDMRDAGGPSNWC